MQKVPVLVTGGAGYIGSHAVLALLDAGWPVAVIDDLSNGTREIVPEAVAFYEGNIAERALVERIFAEQGTKAIMHFAGSIVVPESVEKPLDYYLNNTIATHALLSAAVAKASATSSSRRPPPFTARPRRCRSPRTRISSRSIPMARPS